MSSFSQFICSFANTTETDRQTHRETDRQSSVCAFSFFSFSLVFTVAVVAADGKPHHNGTDAGMGKRQGGLCASHVCLCLCVCMCVCVGGGGLFLLFLLFLLLSPSSHPASSTLKRLCVSPQVLPVENYVNDLADHTFDQLLQSNRFLKVRFENSKRVCFHFSPALPSMFLAP